MPPEPLLSESEDVQAVQDDRPVYFRSIEVENVLCFKSRQTLDLTDANGYPAKWTVILGDNGVGKTTLLRCIAGLEPTATSILSEGSFLHIKIKPPVSTLSEGSSLRVLARILTPNQIIWREREILERSYANLMARFSIGRLDDRITEKSLLGAILFNSNLRHPHKRTPSYNLSGEDLKNIASHKLLGLKCYGYGASRRMGETSLKESLESDSTLSLFSDDATLLNAEEWLLQADYSIASSLRNNTADPKLQLRYDLIKEILEKILPDVEDIRIVMAGENRSGAIAEFLTPYGWVALSSLGLGYRTVIAWTVDLAARMLDRYPDSDDPLSEPAVVMVDEIDLHLHPKWQRTIMTFLGDRFKNTQFIVTAHSPLVVQAAQNANIVLLRREGDEVIIDNNPEIIKNWRVDQVLTSVFELPTSLPADIEPLMERRAKLLSKSKLTAKDERELKKLEDQIGTIPTAESREDIRAMDIIRRAAKLLKNR